MAFLIIGVWGGQGLDSFVRPYLLILFLFWKWLGERERECLPFSGSLLQMHITAWIGQSWNQEPGTKSRFVMWVVGSKHLSYHLLPSWVFIRGELETGRRPGYVPTTLTYRMSVSCLTSYLFYQLPAPILHRTEQQEKLHWGSSMSKYQDFLSRRATSTHKCYLFNQLQTTAGLVYKMYWKTSNTVTCSWIYIFCKLVWELQEKRSWGLSTKRKKTRGWHYGVIEKPLLWGSHLSWAVLCPGSSISDPIPC